MWCASDWKDYILIDAAGGEKLEYWKNILLRRPDPQAKKEAEEIIPNAEKEAAEIVANAKKEAEEIIPNARKEAEEIIANAKKEAAEISEKTKVETSSHEYVVKAILRKYGVEK